MKVNIYNQAGTSSETVELNPKIFAIEKVKPSVIHEVVVSLLSSKRSAVAHSKTRGEIRGGGKKPWQQKGTGRARAGSNRSPLWRGGGITFGPRSNRNWEKKINKKTKTKVLFAVLSDKAQSGQVVVVDDFTLSAPKTKELAMKLKDLRGKFPTLGRNITLLAPDRKSNLFQAGKNLPDVMIETPSDLNILELLARPGLVILKSALPVMEKIYLPEK